MTKEIRNFKTIQSQFLCCVPVRRIDWQDSLQNLKWEEQEHFLSETLKLPELQRFPLQSKYIIRFLRHVIDVLESQGSDVHDEFYTILCEYQSQTDDSIYSFKHYRIQSNDDDSVERVILKENNNKISQGTTGLNVWESALVLSEWIIHHKSYFHEKRILELGAGTGLSSLVAGKCCDAKSVKVSDGNEKVLEILEENFSNNFERCEDRGYVNEKNGTKIDITLLDWTADNEEHILNHFKETELIIAADIIYDNTLFSPLLITIRTLFQHCINCEQFILVNAVRNPDTEREFLSMLVDFGFEYTEKLSIDPKYFHWEQSDIQPIKLYSIRPLRK